MPAGVHGPQRSTRQAARALPTSAPFLRMAPSAKWLQVGLKRQRTPRAPKRGDSVAW